MTKSEQIAQILGIPSTDVIVSTSPFEVDENGETTERDFNGFYVKCKDREWTADELLLINAIMTQSVSEVELKIAQLERKIARLAETGDTESLKEDPEIEYSEGVEVRTGEVLVDLGEKYMMQIGGTLIMREDLRPSVLYEQRGDRTVWQKIQPEIPEEDLCSETPEWNSANWNDYSAGYKVKSGNAIWEAINTTHAWIEPAHEGDGAISWKHVKDCN